MRRRPAAETSDVRGELLAKTRQRQARHVEPTSVGYAVGPNPYTPVVAALEAGEAVVFRAGIDQIVLSLSARGLSTGDMPPGTSCREVPPRPLR